MVSLNQFFALTANSIQNLVAFSRSIGVFKTCIFICDAKSAVSIKMLNWIIILAISPCSVLCISVSLYLCILIQLANVAKPQLPSRHKIYFPHFFSLIPRSSVPLLYFPPSLPRSCSTQQSGFHLHACTLLFKRVWVSVVHSPRTPSCAHTCLSTPPLLPPHQCIEAKLNKK